MAPRARTVRNFFSMRVIERLVEGDIVVQNGATGTEHEARGAPKTQTAAPLTSGSCVAVEDAAGGREVLVTGSACGNNAMGIPGLDDNHVPSGDDPSKPAVNRSQCWPMPASTNQNSAQTSRPRAARLSSVSAATPDSRHACQRARGVESLALEQNAVDRTRPNFVVQRHV